MPVGIEGELYAASGRRLLERLRAVDDGIESLMLLGHNPGVEQFALNLAASGEKLAVLRLKYPTGALATLELSGRWGDLRPGERGAHGLRHAQAAGAAGAALSGCSPVDVPLAGSGGGGRELPGHEAGPAVVVPASGMTGRPSGGWPFLAARTLS